MNTLITFLRARLDDAGEDAFDVHESHCATTGSLPFPCDCGYPEHVRRDIAAKRAILNAYAENDGDVAMHLGPYPRKHGEWDGLRLAVSLLAAIYSGHPDYSGITPAPVIPVTGKEDWHGREIPQNR